MQTSKYQPEQNSVNSVALATTCHYFINKSYSFLTYINLDFHLVKTTFLTKQFFLTKINKYLFVQVTIWAKGSLKMKNVFFNDHYFFPNQNQFHL